MFLILERWWEGERTEDRAGRRKTAEPEEHVRMGTVRAGVALRLIEEFIVRVWLTRAEESRDVQ